jgi:hypothetical protein
MNALNKPQSYWFIEKETKDHRETRRLILWQAVQKSNAPTMTSS